MPILSCGQTALEMSSPAPLVRIVRVRGDLGHATSLPSSSVLRVPPSTPVREQEMSSITFGSFNQCYVNCRSAELN